MLAKRTLNVVLREAGIGLALLVLTVIFAVTAPHFASLTNITNIFTQITMNTILAVGMTFVILIGGIDLSVGSVMALATVVGGSLLVNKSVSLPVAVALCVTGSVAVGMLCGFLNGVVAERWKMPAFIVTLGMMNIARGAALTYTNARTIYEFPPQFVDFGSGSILWGAVPSIFVIAIVLVLVGWFVLSRTVFGRFIYAIGNNEEAVRLSGHNPSLYKIAAYTITGITVGIAGVVYMIRLAIASPILGVGFELNAIAAVVIGGTSMSGGKGSMIGTFLGACIMGVLTNGLILLGVSDFNRQMVTGLVIIIAVILDAYRAKFALQTA